MKPYSILVLLCLIAFMLCNNQFTSGRKRPNLRALRPTSVVKVAGRPALHTSRHVTKVALV